MFNKLLGLGLAVMIAAPMTTAEAAAIFDDRSAWEAAVAGVSTGTTTLTFDTNIVSNSTIFLGSGVTSFVDLVESPGSVNSVGSGQYFGNVGPDAGGIARADFIAWTFDAAIIGFFADFDMINVDGLTVTGDFDGLGAQTISVAANFPFDAGIGSGGFGIIGGASFTSLHWGTNDAGEFFAIDNFAFATADIPEPGTLPLLAVGVAALGWMRSRRAA